MKKIFLLLSFVFSIVTSEAIDYKLKLVLDGKDYDKIFLNLSLLNGKQEQITGNFDQKDHSWSFAIPESTQSDIAFFSYHVCYDEKKNMICSIDFKSVVSDDTVTFNRFVVDPNVTVIHGTYLGTRTISTSDFSGVKVKGKDGMLSFDSFFIADPKCVEWNIAAQYPTFSFFSPRSEDEAGFGYYDYLRQYVEIVKKYPDSISLMNFVVKGRHRYKSAYDLSEVYNEFSESLRASKAGKILADFIKNDCKF